MHNLDRVAIWYMEPTTQTGRSHNLIHPTLDNSHVTQNKTLLQQQQTSNSTEPIIGLHTIEKIIKKIKLIFDLLNWNRES